ncbi:MAG: proteasome protein, partial [Marmoricola sp.]|nr:proteasome protein [Marmoricola sp.]
QTALKEAGEARQVEIATQIADSDDVRDVVTGLEQQYDAFHSQASSLLAEDEPLPSGEEIGAQFEQFLARLEEPED